MESSPDPEAGVQAAGKPAEERASEESFSLRAQEVRQCVDVEKKMTSVLKLQERKNQ